MIKFLGLLQLIKQAGMSRRRNRNNSTSRSFVQQRNNFNSLNNKSFSKNYERSTLYTNNNHSQLKEQDNKGIYNKNISVFRQSFNSNDPSQLPFMSSLRQHEILKTAPKATLAEPFEVALKTTCNQLIKKRISNFSAKIIRLSPAYYRWHNQSGRNNRWSSQFQCSLRDYGDSKNPKQQKFYPYVKPIIYRDFEDKEYNKNEIICHRRIKSFKIKVNDL